MSPKRQEPPAEMSRGLRGSVDSMADLGDRMELVVKLTNPLDRPVYVISDVRGLIFDPATGRLRVQLSDQGRDPLPGGTAMLPRLRQVDPHSEALLSIKLPKSIMKLSETPSPTGEVTFEKHEIADTNQIEVEIGWADTPYYEDPRDKSRGKGTIASWEQQQLRITLTPPSKSGKHQK